MEYETKIDAAHLAPAWACKHLDERHSFNSPSNPAAFLKHQTLAEGLHQSPECVKQVERVGQDSQNLAQERPTALARFGDAGTKIARNASSTSRKS